MLALIYSRTETDAAPEQNSIMNGLIARVELHWESEPATLNKIKPLLYIFIIPHRVLNCKCISEIHRCPSFLKPPTHSSPPSFLLAVSLQQPTLSSFHSPPCPCPRQIHVSVHALKYTHAHAYFTAVVFLCVSLYVCLYVCVEAPLSSLIKGKSCLCLWERGDVCMRKCFWATAELLRLFAIRSDRQRSHIHHCHLPLDFPLSLLNSPHPSLLCFLPPPSAVFFFTTIEIAHFFKSWISQLSLFHNTEYIPFEFINQPCQLFGGCPLYIDQLCPLAS